MSHLLSSDLDFDEFLRKASRNPRREVVVWPQTRLLTHLYDEETERLRPFARAGASASGRQARHKRQPLSYHFTARQLQIARESLERTAARDGT